MREDVTALYVRADGPYPDLVADWYDEARDARNYRGDNPVVAHPPCARWGRWWWADGSTEPGHDGGLFAHALTCVRTYGGVLEHPSHTHAWRHFDLPAAHRGAWVGNVLHPGEWATEVSQSAYGHRAQKRTWLLYVGSEAPPVVDWSDPPPSAWITRPNRGSNSTPHRPADIRGRPVELMGKRERELTPLPFAKLLVDIAAKSKNENQDR